MKIKEQTIYKFFSIILTLISAIMLCCNKADYAICDLLAAILTELWAIGTSSEEGK